MEEVKDKNAGFSLAIWGAVMMAVATGLVSGLSFVVIKYWPLPVSVAPVFGFKGGFLWGAVIGAVSGLVLGFCMDEKHFQKKS